MEVVVDIDSVFLNKCLSCCIVTLGLDSLYLSEKLAEEASESLVVVYYELCLAIANLLLDYVVCKTLLIAPLCDELAVLHVCLHVLLAEGNSCELCEDTVADVA